MNKQLKLFKPSSSAREHELANLPLASFTRRALALFLDFLVLSTIFMIFIYLIGVSGILSNFFESDKKVMLHFTFFKNWYSIIWLVIYFSFSIYFTNGQTLGKWIFRIRVLSLTHKKITFWHSIERALGYGASALEAGFGFFQYFLRDDRRTVHDRVAETIVIYENSRKLNSDAKND